MSEKILYLPAPPSVETGAGRQGGNPSLSLNERNAPNSTRTVPPMGYVTLTLKNMIYPPVVGCRYDSRSDSYRLDKIFVGIPAGSSLPAVGRGFHPRCSEALLAIHYFGLRECKICVIFCYRRVILIIMMRMSPNQISD